MNRPGLRICSAGWIAVGGLLSLAAAHAADASPAKYGDATPLEWSERMANSQIARSPAAPKWDYTTGLFALSLFKLGEQTGNQTYTNYAQTAVLGCINDAGAINGHRTADYNLDMVAPGKVVIAFYEKDKQPRLETALKTLRQQLAGQPRTPSGGFWHKQIYPNQMWLDGLFMGAPYYAQYAKDFNEPADFDDIAKQFILMADHAYDPKTGLFYHGWDETKSLFWANKETGLSPNFWGRAIGWYGMALVDCLDYFPADHPQRAKLIGILGQLADGVARWQDAKSGLWWQVVDQGAREGNYLEATASCMFVYTLTKAVNKGYLPREKFADVIEKGYAGIVRDLITTDANGRINLTKCCSVAGLGPANDTRRNGTFEYYISERVVSNDLKGVGPFILAGLEMMRFGATAGAASAATPTAAAADLTPEEVAKLGWDALPQILAHIKAPTFPDKNFPITDYGAKADGQTDCTDAIRQAIEACNKAGGGHVIVPDGTFLTGGIRLLSNVDLHLADHAKLQFVPGDLSKYPTVTIRYEGVERQNCAPPIYAFEQENIGLTGKGVIDGGGEANWQAVLRPAGQQRPNFVVPFRCKNVLIEGLTVNNSPMWEINPVYCTNVIVRGLHIDSHDGNNDGCDPDSCKYVLIEDCVFDTGDDCIAIKCGKDDDGRRVNIPTEFVIVRNCVMKDGHGGVTLGSECTPAIRNIFVENCEMDSPHLQAFFRFKNSPARGGIIENAYMRNVKVGSIAGGRTDGGVRIELSYQYTAGRTPGNYIPILRNINISNVTGANVPRLVYLQSGPTAVMENFRLTDCTFTGPNPAELEQYKDKITFTNVVIKTPEPAASAAPAPAATTPAAQPN